LMVSLKSSMNFGMGAMKNCDYIATVRNLSNFFWRLMFHFILFLGSPERSYFSLAAVAHKSKMAGGKNVGKNAHPPTRVSNVSNRTYGVPYKHFYQSRQSQSTSGTPVPGTVRRVHNTHPSGLFWPDNQRGLRLGVRNGEGGRRGKRR